MSAVADVSAQADVEHTDVAYQDKHADVEHTHIINCSVFLLIADEKDV